ncbi:MAG: hypothetical protein U1G08_14960 [Verrucomicrobiota bacterium]
MNLNLRPDDGGTEMDSKGSRPVDPGGPGSAIRERDAAEALVSG